MDIKDKSFKQKIKNAFRNAGREVIEHALILFYTLRDPNTPAWCKTTIVGALAYFISMIDGIPDLTPLLGYTDDFAVMISAISVVQAHISEETRAKAKQKSQSLFKDSDQI